MLVDFGIAHSAGGEPLTQTGALDRDGGLPEPRAGRRPHGHSASDLYSLGVVAYLCLSGNLPFHRDSDIATALAHLQDEAPALPDNLPADATALVYGMLAKEPSARPSSGIVVANQAAALATSIPAPPGHAPAITGEPTMPDAAAMPDNTLPGIVERPVDVGADDDAGPATLVGAPVGSAVAAEHARRRRSRRPHGAAQLGPARPRGCGPRLDVAGGGADTVTVPNVEGKSVGAAKTN